jgi:hypothetical protein
MTWTSKSIKAFFSALNVKTKCLLIHAPIRFASLACFVGFISTCLVARFASKSLTDWWRELPIYLIIPLFATFAILRHSHWHSEVGKITRTCWLSLMSCIIFLGVMLVIGVSAIIACFLTIAFKTDMGPS